MTGRRRIFPKSSFPATLDGYALGFNVHSVPFLEPGMATIVKCSAAERAASQEFMKQHGGRPVLSSQAAHHACRAASPVHGVLHHITAKEWEIVKATEGVKLQGMGYYVQQVVCERYPAPGSSGPGERLPALTLIASPFSAGPPEKFLPSPRYLGIIRDGAREHGLSPEYCAMLEAHPSYDPPPTTATLGRAAMVGVALAVGAPFVPLFILSAALSSAQEWLRGESTAHPALAPGPGAATLPPVDTATAADKPVTNGKTPSAGPSATTVASAAPQTVKLADTKPPGGAVGRVMHNLRERVDGRLFALYMLSAFKAMQLSHDWVLVHVLGSGRDNNAAAALKK